MTQALHAAVVKTFAEMAFVDVAAADEHAVVRSSHMLTILLFKPARGELALLLPVGCKRLLVENIYGASWDELADAARDDCLLELLNVLAGNFLNELFGTSVEHSLSLPEMAYDDARARDTNRFVQLTFDAEEQPFRVALAIDQVR